MSTRNSFGGLLGVPAMRAALTEALVEDTYHSTFLPTQTAGWSENGTLTRINLSGISVSTKPTYSRSKANIPLPTGSGYFYVEALQTDYNNSGYYQGGIGLANSTNVSSTSSSACGGSDGNCLMQITTGTVWRMYSTSLVTQQLSQTNQRRVLGMLIDLDAGDIWFNKTDTATGTTLWASSTASSPTSTADLSNPAVTGVDLTTFAHLTLFMSAQGVGFKLNFGDDPTFGGSATPVATNNTYWYADLPDELFTAQRFRGMLSLDEAGIEVPSTDDYPQLNWGGIIGRDVIVSNSLVDTGVLTLGEHGARVFTGPIQTFFFEMWGSGGAGGMNLNSSSSSEDGGPGGGGAYLAGSFTASVGSVLDIIHGAPGGAGAVNDEAGGGGGASGLRLNATNTLIAVAGGGGGGGGAGASSPLDATGGRGGNLVGGSNLRARAASGNLGGQSGSETQAGSTATRSSIAASVGYANPPTKTGLMQDGGPGYDGQDRPYGPTVTILASNPSDWGGSPSLGGKENSNEGAGGGGGAGFFGGSGGQGDMDGNDAGAGGGGGGSYVNTAIVTQHYSVEGSWTAAGNHSANAVTQTAGSSKPAFLSGISTEPVHGGGGRGQGSFTTPAQNGTAGVVILYSEQGVELARTSAYATQVQYTVA